ncbi:MAG: IS66 family transposase [Moorea sp. SIO1G6]|uniref:IS66 family transposase n=1 Tax=Moorena sp. SIO1G6 TaxID=2607840 RepID=UPI0013C1089C|nr:IS66 family transposase [Moorena sp. SIO1G6]NET69445.1 IS66 family transposase [Moorena sp. SIO1G6]
MDRSKLERASRSDLVELILQMDEAFQSLLESHHKVLGRVQELEEAEKKPKKTSKNSSSRPSSDRKASRPKVKTLNKKGAKPGHVGKSRTRSEPDVTIECKLEACTDCGTDLREASHQELGRSQVVEIPPVQPVVVEAIRYGCKCPKCGQEQEASYPEGLERERVFGSRIETTAAYLHEVHHVSYNRLKTLFELLFGLGISNGALVNIVQRVAAKLGPEAEKILAEVRASQIVQSDETGARVNGKNQWQWVFIGDSATYHVVADSRSAQVIKDVMGDSVPLVWVSDLFSAQCVAASRLRQICLAHQIRDLQFAIDAECSVWAYQFQSLLLRAQRLNKRRDELSLAQFHASTFQIEQDCNHLLLQPLDGAEEARLQRRYLKHRQSIFTFLYYSAVPPDNNASERALRNSVIQRKVSGGFRSDNGAKAHATIASVVDTAKQNQQEPFDVISRLNSNPIPLPA